MSGLRLLRRRKQQHLGIASIDLAAPDKQTETPGDGGRRWTRNPYNLK